MVMSSEDLETRRQKSLGAFNVLTDGIISEYILSKLSAEELALSSKISKFFYVFAHDDQLWKKHCLDKWGRDEKVMENFVYRKSWLLSYLFPTLMSEQEEQMIWNHPACQTLYFPDVSSHYLYAKWCRCNMNLCNFVPSLDLPLETKVPVEDGRKLTRERFEAFFDAQLIPVLITNGDIEKWKSWNDWKWENLLQKYGKLVFRVANDHGGKNRYFLMTLESYAHYMKFQRDETPLYVFDNEFADRNSEMTDAYEVPKYFQDDLFETLSEKRPPYRWMIIGPARSGASWHVDPAGTSAWNTLLAGRKRWALYPPHVFPPGLAISRTGMNGHQSLFSEEVLDDTKDSATSLLWYLEVYPQLEPGALPLEIIQEPGQTIFVPSGWWHMVLNIEDTIAITQNFANIHNLEHVCETLISEKDKHQMWELFSEHVTTAYPYLEPFISRRMSFLLDTTDDPIILEEGISSKIDYVESFRNLTLWQPRVMQALERCGIGQNSEINVIARGQNPVFQTPTVVIKFYSHLFDGVNTFTSEINAYSQVQKHISTEFCGYFPKLFGSGYLFDESSERKYCWPFSIIESVSNGGTSLSEVISGTNLCTVLDDDLNNENGIIIWNEVIDFTAKILHALHRIPPILNVVHSNSHPFLEFLSRQLSKASNAHAGWLTFPPHLISQMPSYLPSLLLELYNPELDGAAGFLHGDFNAENILGLITPDDPDDSGSDEITSGHWKATSIIDFGDAHLCGGDPLLDLVTIFISVLGCSKTLLRRFLEKYNREGELKISTRMFARRAMWYTLLLGFEGATKHMMKCLPGIRELGSWFEVETYVWSLDNESTGDTFTR